MITFKVYPGLNNWMARESQLYWTVRVYADRRSMYRFWGKTGASAVVIPQTRRIVGGGEDRVLDSLGFVLFNRGELFGEIVAHEAVHMAAWYLRRTRCSLNLGPDCEDREERLAYATGNCAHQIAQGFYEAGLWP